MPFIHAEILSAYRCQTFRIAPHLQLKSEEEAVEFVNQSGFIFFWPASNLVLPSLWTATVGDRPVPDQHDDPGHITWDWKDKLLSRKVWFYGRVLYQRNAMISLKDLPYFYALSPNFGDPEYDYLDQYQAGQLPMEAKNVYEALLREGPLDTIHLKQSAHLSSQESEGRFNKALNILQMQFRILPVGIAEAGSWRYAFIYDLVHRYFTNLIEEAHFISEPTAQQYLIMEYMKMVGAAKVQDILRLFRWRKQEVDKAVRNLIGQEILISGGKMENQTGEWLVIPGLLG